MTTTDPEVYTIRQGSTRPTLTVFPTRADGTNVDVTGASVRFLIRDVNLAAPLLVASMGVTQSVPAILTYTPSPGDTDVAGSFLGECEVTYADGTRESFPTTGFIPIGITPSLSFGGVPQPGGKSGADWIADTRNYLQGATREALTTLGQSIDTQQTAFVLGHNTVLSLGDRLCNGMETMHVWDYQPTTRTVTVQRGVDGTQPLAGSAGTMVMINPRFPDARIWNALKDSISTIQSAGLWNPKTIVRYFVTPVRGLDLADDMLADRILKVTYQINDNLNVWHEITSWEVEPDVDITQYPSGKMIYFPNDYIIPALWPVRITYAAELGSLRSPADDVLSQVGLPPSALDIPPLYAATQLLVGAPVQRANPNAQPTGRRPDEVSTGDVVASAGPLQRLYMTRIRDEVTRLKQQYPYTQQRRRLGGRLMT